MSIRSNCDIDPSEIDGLDIQDAEQCLPGMESDIIVRKIDETTCLVTWASCNPSPTPPHEVCDQHGRVIILEDCDERQRARLAEALVVEAIDRKGYIDQYDWCDAFEEVEGRNDIDHQAIIRGMAHSIALKRPQAVVDHWINGMALQRIIPENWFIEMCVEDPDTRGWLGRRWPHTKSLDRPSIEALAEHTWRECSVTSVPCADELRNLANDLDVGQPTTGQLERFLVALLKTGDDRVLFDEFADQAWHEYWDENEIGDPDLLELEYSYHASAGPIDLKVRSCLSERPRAFYLFNKDGKECLDAEQDRAAFAVVKESEAGNPQVHVDPEFQDTLGVPGGFLEFDGWVEVRKWFQEAEENPRFTLTPYGRGIGRERIRQEVANSEVQEYMNWANGKVYDLHVERCDYDPDIGEWLPTKLEGAHGCNGDDAAVQEMEFTLDVWTRAILDEKAKAHAPAA